MTDSRGTLRSLSPNYQPEQHDQYVHTLMTELRRPGDVAARNIALTGHYGSGKSSVLVEVERQLTESGTKVINLSLPSLGIGKARLKTPGQQTTLDTTNLIQKEIVKQLLYRRRPSDTPASRYNRLDTFQRGPAVRRAAGAAAALTGLALLIGIPKKVRDAFPARFWTWVNDHLWGSAAITAQWLSLVVIFGLLLGAVVWAQRLFHQRLRLTELAAGPAKVTLSENSTSFFDEYLDEIVYFFQNSKTSVVVFEDLDRFEDAHIFETLRELNMLLNNAEQTGSEPIRFIYAIRDSIFEKLDDEDDAPNSEEPPETATGETRRLMSTNRTKFFDLVVPMVPFISHRTSRQLIVDQLAAVDEAQRPSVAVTDIVSVYLTDMRLIKNICNEYDVFRSRILSKGGLDGLTPDRLFASIVYKNVYMGDYENIRHAESPLDELYRAFRSWVSARSSLARTNEYNARMRLNRISTAAIGYRSKRLGERLQAVLAAWGPRTVQPEQTQVLLAGKRYAWSTLVTPDFWRTYLGDPQDLQLIYTPGYIAEGGSLSHEDLEVLMNESLALSDWETADRKEQSKVMGMAAAEQRLVAKSSLTEALGESGKTFMYDGEQLALTEVASRIFAEQQMVLELLHAGYLDENFALYVTQFPGQGSAKAMNFILKAVQPDEMDKDYQFGSSAASKTDDIEAVIQSEGLRLLHGRSVYNIEIFDHLLATDPAKLSDAVRRLARSADSDQEFIDAYLTSGQRAAEFVGLLSPEWTGIFRYLIGDDPDVREVSWLDAALRGADPSLSYELGDGQREVLVAALPDLPLAAEPLKASMARSIARTLENLNVRVRDIEAIEEPLRSELAVRDLYEVTRDNLVTLLGTSEQLPLDRIKAGRDEVYKNMLGDLSRYLAVVAEAEPIATIADPDQFGDILTDVAEADPKALTPVASGAAGGCMLDDLSALNATHWSAIARAGRLRATVPNVTQYVAEVGLDAAIIEHLSTLRSFAVVKGEAGRLELGLMVLNSDAFDDDVKMALLGSLSLTRGSVVVSSLQAQAHSLIPRLVAGGWVSDDADAYTCLGEDEWPVKQELINASSKFTEYMTSLAFTPNELRELAGPEIPDAVQEILLREYSRFEGNLGSNGATRLATWAVTHARALEATVLVGLATKGGARSAEPIVQLLGAQSSSLDLESVRAALNALGTPYNQLTRTGRDRPKVTQQAGIDAVLARLQREGIVSKYELKSKRGQTRFEVSKRHA